MKKITSIFLVMFAISCTSIKESPVAEGTSVNKEKQQESSTLSQLEYYLIWNHNGDMYVRYYDKIIPIKQKTLIMDDGVIITPTGRIFMPDGRRFQMKEGRKMYLSGIRAGEMESEATAHK